MAKEKRLTSGNLVTSTEQFNEVLTPVAGAMRNEGYDLRLGTATPNSEDKIGFHFPDTATIFSYSAPDPVTKFEFELRVAQGRSARRKTKKPVQGIDSRGQHVESSGLPGVQESLRAISSIGEFFEAAGNAAAQICLENDFIPKGVDKEKARKVLEKADYSGVSSTDTEYDGLLASGMIKAHVERRLIRQALQEGENQLGLSSTEKEVLLGSCDIADQYDRLYWQWRKDVITSPLGLKLREIPEEERKVYFVDKVDNYNPDAEVHYFTLTENADGSLSTHSYAEAFPDATAGISNAITNLVENLTHVIPQDDIEGRERDALLTYYSLLNKAISSKDIQEHEELYKKVDEAWMAIQGRMQPIHNMEYYRDPFSMLVEPDYALAVRDDRKSNQVFNDQIGTTHQKLIGYLEGDFGEMDSFVPSLFPMVNSVAGVFTMLKAGARLDFMSGAQTVPNRPDVRLANGAKVFLDVKSLSDSDAKKQERFEAIFGKRAARKLSSDSERRIKYAIGTYVPGYEIAHSAFLASDTREKLGESVEHQIETAKSYLAITAATPDIVDTEDLPIAVQSILGWCLGELTFRGVDEVKPYYNTALLYLDTMREVGILQETGPRSFTYDANSANVGAFFTEIKRIFTDEMVEIYNTKDPTKAIAFMENHFQEKPYISKLLAKMKAAQRRKS